MSRRPLWETIFERFDPMKPAETPAWRADRPLSPFEDINRALDRPFGTPRLLLTGTMGTGKTTELLRIAEARVSKEFVVFLDLVRHFDQVVGDVVALQHVSPWEVCFLAGIALIRSAEERLAFTFPAAHIEELKQAWLKLARSSGEVPEEPAIDIAKLAKSMVLLASTAAPSMAAGPVGAAAGLGLRTLSAAADAAKWSLPIGLKKKSLPDQDTQVQTLLQCVNVLIGLVQQRSSKVLMIIDGLDRIDTTERARDLFVSSQMIGHLACRLVLCGPFGLRHDGAIANVQAFSDVRPLENIPVLSQHDPSVPGPGVSFFRELFARRVADVGGADLIAPDLLDKLAYYSGGRAREFVQSVRRLAELAWDADVNSATAEVVDKVLDDRRRVRETGMNRSKIRLLESVVADPDHRLPEGEDVSTLLTTGALLPFPDGSEWYYPHPLLMMKLIRRRPAGSTS